MADSLTRELVAPSSSDVEDAAPLSELIARFENSIFLTPVEVKSGNDGAGRVNTGQFAKKYYPGFESHARFRHQQRHDSAIGRVATNRCLNALGIATPVSRIDGCLVQRPVEVGKCADIVFGVVCANSWHSTLKDNGNPHNIYADFL